MAIPSNLLRFRAPGVYLVTQDQSQLPAISAPTGARLLIGNSKQGPVGRPILIQDWTEFKSIFGDISRSEERKGDFSKRSAFYMLQVAPIYYLNLRAFDDDKDRAGRIDFSMSTEKDNGVAENVAYRSLFDRNQFWTINPEELIKPTNTDQLITFANVGTKKLTVIIRKSTTFNSTLTFEQWYANTGRTMPDYVYPNDRVSDWFIDVFVFANDFSDSAKNIANANYGFLFTEHGVRKTYVNEIGDTVDGLTALSRIAESGHIATFSGSLIPGFTDESNQSRDIVQTINASVDSVGVVAAYNMTLFDNAADWVGEVDEFDNPDYASNGQKKAIPVDLLGHNVCNIDVDGAFDLSTYEAAEIKTASYHIQTLAETVIQDVETVTDVDVLVPASSSATLHAIHNTLFPGVEVENSGDYTYSIADGNTTVFYAFEATKPNVGDKYVAKDGNLATVKSLNFVGVKTFLRGFGTYQLPIQPSGTFDDGASGTFTYPNPHEPFPKNVDGLYIYPVGHPLAGEPIVGSIANDLKVVHNPSAANVADYAFQTFEDGTLATITYPVAGYTPAAEEYITIAIDDLSGAELEAVKTDAGYKQNVYRVQLDKQLVLNDITTGAGSTDAYTSVGARSSKSVLVLDDSTELIVYNNNNVSFRVKTLEQIATVYKTFALTSYRPRKEQFVDGTARRQNEILNMLTSDLRNALKNRELIDFEYLVDGFKSYVEPSIKLQLATIANERVTLLALSNMPFMSDFKKSTNPYFTRDIGGTFDPAYIAQGGNLQLPYTNTFSLPVTGNTNIAFFGPGVIVNDGSESFIFPAAALVSNAYARKYQGGNVYDIVAGSQNGRISGQGVAGVEYTFKPSDITGGGGDLDVLHPFGYNAIVNKATGLQIYGNRTAQNNIETALSQIHVREIVKYIQLQMLQLLEEYVFKYNTAANRLEAKTRADSITSPIVAAGALLAAVNICNEQNNTPEIIDRKLFLLDTIITANNGIEIAVHRTTINLASNTATFELL